MAKKTIRSQIATIIIFIIAVLFLFALITINISRLSQKKTSLDNVADSVGIGLASQLGSMANALKHELEIYGSDPENCELNWQLMAGGLIAAIVIAVVTALSLGTLSIAAIGGAAGILSLIGAATIG